MKTYGLLGKNIDYSFSRAYFSEKFKLENINARYQNFDLENLDDFQKIIKRKDIAGLNVTIPYKELIIPHLDELNEDARQIRAVNTIKFEKNSGLTGYNTDYIGFLQSLKPHLKAQHKKALILGTGGASKAVAYAFKKLDIDFTLVSRNPKEGAASYADLTKEQIQQSKLIVNTTPLGTHPRVEEYPPLPFQFITSEHFVYDLIYNPEVTQFLKRSAQQGAKICNGHKMLELQAEKAWEIWNSR